MSCGSVGRRPTVSVIVPVYRGGEAFRSCLRSLAASDLTPYETIVVVDGRAEGDVDADLARGLGMVVLETGTRSGPARARNVGAKHARGEVLLFIDADVTVGATTVGDVARAFADEPELDALIGSYDEQPAAPNFLSQYKNLFHHFVHQGASEDGHTFWGACGGVRRARFLEVGGFDENYARACIEDIELGMRLKAGGGRIALLKDVQVKHLKRWTPGSLLYSDFFCRALPWTDLILRSGNMEDDLNTDRSTRLKVALGFAMVGLTLLAARWPASLAAALLVAFVLLVLDRHLLRFFAAKRGLAFAARTIPWTWFYYLYCGLGFAVGLMIHLLSPADRREWGSVLPPPLAEGSAFECHSP